MGIQPSGDPGAVGVWVGDKAEERGKGVEGGLDEEGGLNCTLHEGRQGGVARRDAKRGGGLTDVGQTHKIKNHHSFD